MANIFENKNVIYCYTNKINNKKYIGQTSKKLIDRHKQHLKESKNKNRKYYNIPFHKAIRKYGIKNFKLEILHFAQSKEELNYFEIFYIKYYNSYAKYELGYNVASGGHNGMKNIIGLLGDQNIKRIRIGISRDTKYEVCDYVLSKIAGEDKKEFDKALDRASDAVLYWLDERDYNKVMSKFN